MYVYALLGWLCHRGALPQSWPCRQGALPMSATWRVEMDWGEWGEGDGK